MKKREWKRAAKFAEDQRDAAEERATALSNRLRDIDVGIGECWQALRDDGCTDCGRLPDVLKAWLRRDRT